jgi:acetate kinase
LEFLGVAIDHARNQQNDAVISKEDGRATVRVIHTDEEREIAASVMALLSAG